MILSSRLVLTIRMPSVAQLKYILAVHEHGHFGKAAEACQVSQPTLSGQIQKAEEELGVVLFVRQQKPIVATEKGAVLIEHAQSVVAAHDRLLHIARGQFETVAGELALGVIPTLAPYVLPWFLKRFAKDYPQVNLTVVERTTDGILDSLDRRRLDVGLLATPLGSSSIRERVLFYDPFYIYAEASEPILERDEIAPVDLAPEQLWLLEDGHCVRHQTLALCDMVEGCSHLSSVRFEAASFETLQYLIDASGGYTLVPETFARLLPAERRRRQIRPFSEPTPTRQISLVHLASAYKTDLIDALEAAISASVPRALRQEPPQVEVLPVRGVRAVRP